MTRLTLQRFSADTIVPCLFNDCPLPPPPYPHKLPSAPPHVSLLIYFYFYIYSSLFSHGISWGEIRGLPVKILPDSLSNRLTSEDLLVSTPHSHTHTQPLHRMGYMSHGLFIAVLFSAVNVCMHYTVTLEIQVILFLFFALI